MRSILVAVGCVALLAWAGGAGALVIVSGDGSGNTTPPPDDPGFANAGVVDNLTAVYLGDGWVLTAAHVGADPILLGGVLYEAVPGSTVQLTTGAKNADLILFRVTADPGLPSLAIASGPPTGELVLIGKGRRRAATGIDVDEDPEIDGWTWLGPGMRWGTNTVFDVDQTLVANGRETTAFLTELTEVGGTTHEAQAAPGDSGGPVFAKSGGSWELAGIMLAITGLPGQPAQTTLFGNLTWSAQLGSYRAALLTAMAERACSNGVDDDGDGLVDGDDWGCADPDDAFETSAAMACDNGLDDDGDGAVDFPDDPGCSVPMSGLEAPECSDGADNDGDGDTDFDGGAFVHGAPVGDADVHCFAAIDEAEGAGACGLGFELGLLLPILRLRGRASA